VVNPPFPVRLCALCDAVEIVPLFIPADSPYLIPMTGPDIRQLHEQLGARFGTLNDPKSSSTMATLEENTTPAKRSRRLIELRAGFAWPAPIAPAFSTVRSRMMSTS